MELFPPRDALRDSYSMFGNKYAYIIYEDMSIEKNVLTNSKIETISNIHQKIISEIQSVKLKKNFF